jgi:hypothetical protein
MQAARATSIASLGARIPRDIQGVLQIDVGVTAEDHRLRDHPGSVPRHPEREPD